MGENQWVNFPVRAVKVPTSEYREAEALSAFSSECCEAQAVGVSSSEYCQVELVGAFFSKCRGSLDGLRYAC